MKERRQEYLRNLLEQRKWTIEEKEWMLDYLEANELSDLEIVAAEEFNMDLASMKRGIDKRLSEDLLKKIHQRIQNQQSSDKKVVRMRWMRISVAACVTLLAGLGYWLIKTEGFQDVNGKKVFTAADERKSVRLPDGSLVSLEPGTELDYPDAFSGTTREVHLKGEAFFEITKDAAHPFIIHTRHVSTTVLGTSFNVEAYDSKDPSVVVVTGRVRVQTENNEPQMLVLNPNQSVVYHSRTNELREKDAQEEALFYQQRRNGKFVYKGTALEKVVTDLERFYNISIAIEGNAKKCIFYGDFFTKDAIDKALSLLAISLNATIKKDRTGKGYLIVGGSCS